ncbi:hypothetical protein Aduo_012621 [Ancylostoma duodenale]
MSNVMLVAGAWRRHSDERRPLQLTCRPLLFPMFRNVVFIAGNQTAGSPLIAAAQSDKERKRTEKFMVGTAPI